MTSYVMNAEPGKYLLDGQDVRLLVHQGQALIKHTQTLARLCSEHEGDNRAALVTAVFLTAGAAAEAILAEAAHDKAPQLYGDGKFLKAGAPVKYAALFGEPAPEQLDHLWYVRKALQHSEPDNPRSGEKGAYLTVDAAAAIARFVAELAQQAARL